MKKSLLATILITALTTSSVFAWDDSNQHNNHHDGKQCNMRSSMMNYHPHGMKGNRIRQQMDRSYSADQIKTITEARLIKKGNPNIKVGKVSPTSDGYKIRIVTQENSLVKEYNVAKNGMPMERYKAIKEKIEKREENRGS